MPNSTTRQRRRRWLREARAVVRSRYRDPDLSLAAVAQEVGISSRQLQRIFREEGGEDFRGYLLRVRMEKAAELLSRKRNPLPIRVAARRVGYRQASGLRQAFLLRLQPVDHSAGPARVLGDVAVPRLVRAFRRVFKVCWPVVDTTRRFSCSLRRTPNLNFPELSRVVGSKSMHGLDVLRQFM